jgi:stage V sporulation protein SpoVS
LSEAVVYRAGEVNLKNTGADLINRGTKHMAIATRYPFGYI